MSSLLNELRRKNPYQVPENYFVISEDEIMTKILKEPKGKYFPLQPYLKISMGIAATLILGVSTYYFVASNSMNTMTAKQLKSALKTIPDEELNYYVMTNIDGMNDELLAQTLDINQNIYKMEMNTADSTMIEEYINEVDDAFILEQN